MRSRILILLIITLSISAATVFGQTSWLDRPLNRNWNNGDGMVPSAPRTFAPIDARCRASVRTPESLADRAVTRAGWSLFGPSQSYGTVTVVMAMAGVDGQCRPNNYNAFVFVANRFAGTLSPTAVDSRTDGAFGRIQLFNQTSLSAEFSRYTSTDPLCCPSQTSTVNYSIGTGARSVVKADTVDTSAACRNDDGPQTQDNVVSGTVTYRQRLALPQTAVLMVRLLDASRLDTAASVIAEDRIDLAGKQVPVPFDLAYDRGKIEERNRYVIRAEIRDGERLLFTTDTSHPVITQGNPRNVEITLAQVGGGGGGGGQRDNTIRGTVTYRQRIALAPNSEVKVRLVDSGEPTGRAVAETTVSTGNRQVPIAFELPFEMRDINRQRTYELQAEIRSGGQLRFKTERGVPVTLRGNQTDSVELVVVTASEGPEPITGQTLSVSKFGTGSMQIGDRGAMFLIRGSVVVRANDDAEVTLSRLDGSITFSGKLTLFESNTLRITATNSGTADASGEIEVRYSGRSLTSLTASNLVVDGQNVTIRF